MIQRKACQVLFIPAIYRIALDLPIAMRVAQLCLLFIVYLDSFSQAVRQVFVY